MNDAIRDALFDLLKAAAIPVPPASSGPPAVEIYDHVPQPRPAMPYIALDETSTEPFDTDTSNGLDTITVLRVFSSYKGARQVSVLLDRLHTLLHHKALTVTGATFVSMQVTGTENERDSDGATRTGVCRVRVIVDDI